MRENCADPYICLEGPLDGVLTSNLPTEIASFVALRPSGRIAKRSLRATLPSSAIWGIYFRSRVIPKHSKRCDSDTVLNTPQCIRKPSSRRQRLSLARSCRRLVCLLNRKMQIHTTTPPRQRSPMTEQANFSNNKCSRVGVKVSLFLLLARLRILGSAITCGSSRDAAAVGQCDAPRIDQMRAVLGKIAIHHQGVP